MGCLDIGERSLAACNSCRAPVGRETKKRKGGAGEGEDENTEIEKQKDDTEKKMMEKRGREKKKEGKTGGKGNPMKGATKKKEKLIRRK